MEIGDRWVRGSEPDAVRLADVHVRLNRVWLELLDLVPELDSREAWLRNAATDMATWLEFELGMTGRTARRLVRMGHALVELPRTREAFAAGLVSFDELQVLCRFATPENEEELLDVVRVVGVGELATAIKEFLGRPSARQEQPVELRPVSEVRMWWDEDVLQVRGQVPGADGLVVETALLRLAAQAPPDPVTGLYRDAAERDGAALVQLASESLAADGDHDRATVVVHVSTAELADPSAVVRVGGREILRDELLRLTCDGRIQPAIDDRYGFTLGIGRVSRQVPTWLRRLLEDRDGGCRFPGCGRTRWLHAHHIIHWVNEGPTNLDNLVLMCGFHHRLIHAEGWEIVGHPSAELGWRNKWGQVHQPARFRFRPDHQRLLVESVDHYRRAWMKQLAHANAPP